jgi:hypothetical protein
MCFCSSPAQKGLKIEARWLHTHRARPFRRAVGENAFAGPGGVPAKKKTHRDGEDRVHLGGQAGHGQGRAQLLVTSVGVLQ